MARPPAGPPATVALSPADTAATFTARGLGRPVTGRVPVVAATVTTGADGEPVSVTADLDLDGLDTGNPRRDRDLRKPGPLDLDRIPALSFRSTGVTVGEGGWSVTGHLTRGEHTTPVTLTVTRAGDRFVAEGPLDRRDLGVRAPRLMIGRQVTLRITTPAW